MHKKSDNTLALKAAFYYLVAGTIWIVSSDFILGHVASSISELSWAQTLKGCLFIVASALMVYLIFKSFIAKAHREEGLRKIGLAAASIVHDLKNQIHVIQSALDLLEFDDSSRAERDEYKKLIDDRIKSLLSLSQDILEYSRGDLKVELTVISMHQLCKKIVSNLGPVFSQSGLSLEYTNETDCNNEPWVNADELKLERAIVNLLINSSQACQKDCTIGLCIKIEDCLVHVEVYDNGPGVDPALGDTLFEPFVSHGRKKGTGLGLAIVKAIIDSHGGSIELVPADEGALFRISLDRAPSQIGISPGGASVATAVTR